MIHNNPIVSAHSEMQGFRFVGVYLYYGAGFMLVED